MSSRKSIQHSYNPNNELVKTIINTEEGFNLTEITATYYYDAFGRRIAKTSDTKVKSKFINDKHLKTVKYHLKKQKTQHKSIYYLWDGNRQAQEYTDTHVFTTVHEQDSFEPVARLVWLRDGVTLAANDEGWYGNNKPEPLSAIQIYHYHNDHLGTPNELTSQDGEVVWLADYQAWGNTAKVVWREEKLEQLQVSAGEPQPIRFQGQSFDVETGLHYNRFRYFDPDLGMFISRDPIGLDGGDNVFAYAPNPTGWIDPFGLAKKKKSCCDEEDKVCGSKQNPWKKIYEENAGKHKTKGYWSGKNWVSPKPKNGASYLQTAIPYRTKSLVGYDPVNDEVIQFNRHQIDNTNCIHYYHGFVVSGQPVKMDQTILNIANSIGFKGKK